MTYAIVKTGGKQYRVEKDTEVFVEKLELDVDKELDLEVILVVVDGKTQTKGKVKAKIVEHGKGDKMRIFKYKPKKNYRRTQGHRQPFTKLKITSIA
ncbi:MAG: 50S ribosomal protein L21 [Firmicutes bacterium]|nr:50S ribosomal protein L21 [Bacillota bacterium]